MNKQSSGSEQQIRSRLGIPDEAREVLILTESSHWDPDWLQTADEYYSRFVQSNIDLAIPELEREPRRVYGIECVFFLRMYWERNPGKQERLRRLVNSGQMRLTGSGVILRDFLIGQEWLRKNGLNQEPDLAYFTDSFGCTPALPSLLKAAGFDRTAITRMDGMFFFACDLESSKHFPRKSTSAELLLKEEQSLDFIWQDNNGAEVLCHWNAFTYGQADMFAHAGIGRIYLAHLAVSLRSDRHIARQIKTYGAQLSPLSRTPYMCAPIGFDFVEPIRDIVSLLDRYNQKHYPDTGIWVVNAGLDDYLALVECHKDKLPVVNLDPNPYWTGFYAARPLLKQQCRSLVDKLLLAESLSFLPGNKGAEKTISADLEKPWWTAVVSNHHDFITGTSPDRVVEEEQIPWLDQAEEVTDAVLAGLQTSGGYETSPVKQGKQKKPGNTGELSWTREDGLVRITTPFHEVVLGENKGGGILSLTARGSGVIAGQALLSGVSNDLVSYRDSGGLWRMGMEFAGGKWKQSLRAGSLTAGIQVIEHGDELETISSVVLNGESFTRSMRFGSHNPVIRCRVEGKAAQGYSVMLRLKTGIHAELLSMDTPGGMIDRPLERFYKPTFWPLHRFVHLRDGESGRGLAVMQQAPGAVACDENGVIELAAMRNATKETVLGFIGIPGNPASGHEKDAYSFEYSLLFTGGGDWRDNGVHSLVQRSLADSPVSVDSPDVTVTALKPASRGDGIIIRLYADFCLEDPVILDASAMDFNKAYLCDSRERDIESLEVRDGSVFLRMKGNIASIRLSAGSSEHE